MDFFPSNSYPEYFTAIQNKRQQTEQYLFLPILKDPSCGFVLPIYIQSTWGISITLSKNQLEIQQGPAAKAQDYNTFR